MKIYLWIGISLLFLFLIIPQFTKDLYHRPITEKLGYLPNGRFIKLISGEYRWFLGEYFTFKAVVYYGSMIKNLEKNIIKPVEYYNLYKTIETAVLLNPYHEDSYYFAQAVFVWDIRRVKEINSLLKYVFKYRKWDYQIPFFLGFNYAFFLKDYQKAAFYFKKAAEISHISLFANLSARFFYESGNTKLGIIFLEYMISHTQKESLKLLYKKRLTALKRILFLEKAVKKYEKLYGTKPCSLKELIKTGIIKKIPPDPYGGHFYIDKKGRIRTTSHLASTKNRSFR